MNEAEKHIGNLKYVAQMFDPPESETWERAIEYCQAATDYIERMDKLLRDAPCGCSLRDINNWNNVLHGKDIPIDLHHDLCWKREIDAPRGE